MRIRWIALVWIAGIVVAWRYDNLSAGFVATFGCLIVFALRAIEGNVAGCRDELSMFNHRGTYDGAFSQLPVKDSGCRLSNIYAGDQTTPAA
jgi:hypothetical protein